MAQHLPPQPPQRAFSGYSNAGSPSPTLNSPGISLPPAKKQRLSPTLPGMAAQTSPSFPSLALPRPGAASPPYSQNQQPMLSPQVADAPRGGGPTGLMGPPQRPVDHGDEMEKPEKATDLNTLNDVLASTGVDEREEENYLAATYRNQHSLYTASYGTQGASTGYYGYGSYQQGSGPQLKGEGTLDGPPVTEEQVERELWEKHRRAAREHAEFHAQHLRGPFLHANSTRVRMQKLAYQQGVQLNLTGLYERLPQPQTPAVRPSATVAVGSDDSGIVAAQMAPAQLDMTAPTVEILSLLSLAANERLRNLLEDAYALSRGRRQNSNGVVPAEWASLAVGRNPQPTTAVSFSATDSAWDRPAGLTQSSEESNPLKRKSPADEPTVQAPQHLPTAPPTPQSTIQFASATPSVTALRAIARAERDAEQARLRARLERRKRTSEPGGDSSAGTPVPGTPAAASTPTPGTPAAAAAATPSEKGPGGKPLTKKERDKLAKSNLSEEAYRRNANATANLQLGGLGGKKKYSWMSAGSGTASPRPGGIASISATGTLSGSSPAAKAAAGAAGADEQVQGKLFKWGEWHENGERGKGIQIRDWIGALETDGRERRALSTTLLHLNSRDTKDSERTSR